MHDNLWDHPSEEIFEQAEREPKIGPIMSIFHYVQGIPLEVHLLIKVHLMEGLHWNLRSAMILRPMPLFPEMQIMLYRAARVSCFLVLPRRNDGSDIPERYDDWNTKA